MFQGRERQDGQRLMTPIDKVVEWAKTSHGGKQIELFYTDAPGCQMWGLCDLGTNEPEPWSPSTSTAQPALGLGVPPATFEERSRAPRTGAGDAMVSAAMTATAPGSIDLLVSPSLKGSVVLAHLTETCAHCRANLLDLLIDIVESLHRVVEVTCHPL